MEWRKLSSTIILASVLTLLFSQQYAGFGIFLVILPLVPWLLYSTYVVITKPARRQIQACKAAIWIAVVVAVISIHAYRDAVARKHANQIVQAVRNYARVHGHCPPDLAAAGIAPVTTKETLRHVWYRCEPGSVTLTYPSTFVIFDSESYDFGTGVWTHMGD